ncbi:putative YkwD family protein [Natranaerovirga pectinivora]|uniref:Putative YkwD family protein n=1 Tax=Natranaerovirga pectinivora TaxID=682400 RepID=A0A4R3MI33_9FIRM|nr:CAP domain-containing protein [Natranaerovirga pectinivora]TCT12936.1 putative YkwD family protein [Natranaerovirga pectinivora]
MKLRKFSAVFMISMLLLLTISPSVLARNVYKWTNIKEIQVTANQLNVRTGPSTDFPVIGTLNQNQVVEVVGTLGSWFVVHLDNNSVGCVSSTWTRVYSYHNQQEAPPTPTPTPSPGQNLTQLNALEREFFDLVNAERRKNGLTEYKIDLEVSRVARIKAQDMADNKYFSHTSPVYGSPFDMLKSFGINYRTAGENIAGNNTVQRAHNALMNSTGHRANILSTNYDSIGVGIVPDPRYGYVFVQLFIRR